MSDEKAKSDYLARVVERNKTKLLDAVQRYDAEMLVETAVRNIEASRKKIRREMKATRKRTQANTRSTKPAAVTATTKQATGHKVQRTVQTVHVDAPRVGRKSRHRIRASRGQLEAIVITLDWESERMVRGVRLHGSDTRQMGIVQLDQLDWVDSDGRPVNRNIENPIRAIYRLLWNPVADGLAYKYPSPFCQGWKGLKPSTFTADWTINRQVEIWRSMAEADLDRLVIDDEATYSEEHLALADIAVMMLDKIERCNPDNSKHPRPIRSQRKILVPVQTLEKVREIRASNLKTLMAQVIVTLHLDGVPIMAPVVRPVLEACFNETVSERTVNRHLADMGFQPSDRVLHNAIWTPKTGVLRALLDQGVIYPVVRSEDDLRAILAIMRADD